MSAEQTDEVLPEAFSDRSLTCPWAGSETRPYTINLGWIELVGECLCVLPFMRSESTYLFNSPTKSSSIIFFTVSAS